VDKKLFGFRYSWLEPAFSDDPRFEHADQFISIAKDIAQIAVEGLPEDYNYSVVSEKVVSSEQINMAMSGEVDKANSELLLIASLQYLMSALEKGEVSTVTGLRVERAWEELSLSRSMAFKATGKDANGWDRDFFANKGRKGGNTYSRMRNKIREDLCKAIHDYLVNNCIWNDPDEKATISRVTPIIWDKIQAAHDAGTTWNGISEDVLSHASFGMRTVKGCVSNSKRKAI